MKALTFLEWYFKSFQTTEIYKLRDVANFYNQPFTVDFLVNPVMADCVNIQPLIQQSESLRLFEGWELKDENIININRPIYYITQNSRGLRFCSASLGLMYFNTLNDFITLCNLAGIELRFNKSNETIRNLFGKE